MYKPGFLFDRTPAERTDPLLFWQREDQAFFAAGACHILAEMFRQLHQGEDFHIIFMKAKEGYPGAHVYIRYGEWIFDHNGWTLEQEMIDTVRAGFRERYPGWDFDQTIIQEDLETFCRKNNHRLPSEYAHLPWERADRYIKKFPNRPPAQA
ncbi:hypothetical protein KBD34_01810 [Patescibacteria group bacterium]|nr:hypothetical protein [Patescibacteria group bacterium]